MYENLLEIAERASNMAYCPYSNFCVGAALLTKDGTIYSGCNIENDGIQSICAERVAFAKAISETGENSKPENYVTIMVVAHKKDSEILLESLPCGYCRQFMSEFVNSDFKILTYKNEEIVEYKISELLPYNFKLKEQ